MKKISLKDVRSSLERDEMRMISGGSGSSNDGYCTCGSGPRILLPMGCNCTCYCEGYKCS